MGRIPKAQEIYKHFKGNLYQIVSVAEHTETGEMLVVYQAMYGDFKIYARPLEMFVSKVDRDKYPDATQEYRFELQSAWRDNEFEVKKPDVAAVRETVTRAVTEEEAQIDPMLLEFLDADNCEKRLNILAGMHHRITDDMLTTMSVVCDIELPDGDVEMRYVQLRNCLLTRNKYEIERP